MLVSVFSTLDDKFFLYVPFDSKSQNQLSYYELPAEIVGLFKRNRFLMTVDAEKKNLVQIKDKTEFLKAIEEQKFYLVSVEEDFLEKLINTNYNKSKSEQEKFKAMVKDDSLNG